MSNEQNNSKENQVQEPEVKDAERGKSAVAPVSGSRLNLAPLIVIFILLTGALVGGYYLWQSSRADKDNKEISGNASSKSALANANQKESGNNKKLGIENEDPEIRVGSSRSEPKELTVPAIDKDYNTQAVPLQGQAQNGQMPRNRHDAPSSFDAAPFGSGGGNMGNYGGAPAQTTYNNPNARGANAPDYSVPAQPPAQFLPQANQNTDRNTLNLNTSPTSTARASMIGNRDFILPKGAFIDCAMDTAINSTVPGMVRCTTTKDAYSDNGRVVLVGRGSTITGEYRSDIKNGQARIQVIWNRIKTPEGVVIEPASPASDSLGRGGVDGDVDNHWFDRVGAAFLTSVIKDAIAYATAKDNTGVSAISNNAYQNTTQSGEQLSSQILKETINIPPTITRNQGTRVKVYLARDLDFSAVYSLRTID